MASGLYFVIDDTCTEERDVCDLNAVVTQNLNLSKSQAFYTNHGMIKGSWSLKVKTCPKYYYKTIVFHVCI